MKVRKEEYFVCEGCGSLYEVDVTASPRDHLGNYFCDSCTESNDALYRKYWDKRGEQYPKYFSHFPNRNWM